MSKIEQIEEMAKTVCHLDRTCDECMTSFECKAMMYAKRFYNAGYRKDSEVAEEIFGEIEFEIHQLDFDREETRAIAIEGIIASVKKKYIGKDTNVTTKESENNNE